MHHERFYVTLIAGDNEFLACPAYGLLEVIDTDADRRIVRAYFSNVSRKYPSEPGAPVLVTRPVFIYDAGHVDPSAAAPVTPQEVLNALRGILGQIGPDMAAYSRVRHAYDLMERIDRDGIVGANKDTL